MVAPRTSLLWKPRPAAAKNSVLFQGPSVTEAFGLMRSSLPDPELAAKSLSTR
jgi:hypothetical protein